MPRRCLMLVALSALLAVVASPMGAIGGPESVRRDGTATGAEPATNPTCYTVDAVLDPDARTITGVFEVGFSNHAHRPLEEVALVLYPNRFARAEPGINDLNRPFVYPREVLVPGGITVEDLETTPGTRAAVRSLDAFRRAGASRLESIDGWVDTLLRVPLPAALLPGESMRLRARFRTVLPERYGPFGVAEGRVTALAGWFPFLPALAVDGTWDATAAAPPTCVYGHLRAPTANTVMLGAGVCAEGHDGTCPVSVAPAPGPPGPALLASTDYRRTDREVGGNVITLLELPTRRAFRLPPRAPYAETILDAVERIVRERPAALPPLAQPLLVAQAPLRLELTAPGGPGVAIVSDRILRVHRLLREFHERELATAVYAAWLHPLVTARESPADAPWIVEGLAAELADRWLATVHPRHRTVYDWIGLFNVFAIVDRFESAPKIPFARAFFPEARHAEELRDGAASFARDRPPGRTIFTKLENAIGDATFETAVDGYLAGTASFRDALAAPASRAGQSVDRILADWTGPYPEPLDYALDPVRLNEKDPAPPRSESAATIDRRTRAAVPPHVDGRANFDPADQRDRRARAARPRRPALASHLAGGH